MTTDTRKVYENALATLSDDMAAVELFDGNKSFVDAIKTADAIAPEALLISRVYAHQTAAYKDERDMWDDLSQYRYESLKVLEREIVPKAKEVLKAALAA